MVYIGVRGTRRMILSVTACGEIREHSMLPTAKDKESAGAHHVREGEVGGGGGGRDMSGGAERLGRQMFSDSRWSLHLTGGVEARQMISTRKTKTNKQCGHD